MKQLALLASLMGEVDFDDAVKTCRENPEVFRIAELASYELFRLKVCIEELGDLKVEAKLRLIS